MRRRTAGAAPQPSRTETVEKLRGWAQALSEAVQGQGSNEHKATVRAAAAADILRHTDAEVRLWAAKCLAEGLRIFAPEPPLNARQRRAALDLFVEQLRSLAQPRGSSFQHALGLLEDLTDIRAFMLVFDCEGHEGDLVASLVAACLAASRADDRGVLESPLARLLADLLGECDDIPEAALRPLLDELVATPRRHDRSAAQGRSGDLVRRVLGSLATRNAALPINEFLNRVLYGDASNRDCAAQAEEEEFAEASLVSQERREALLKVVYELYAIDAALVSRVFPHLHADLLSKDASRRRAVTSLVGRMLAFNPQSQGQGSAPQELLVERFPLLLDRHLERLEDADEGVRIAAWEGAQAMLLHAASCGCAAASASERAAAPSGEQAILAAADRIRKHLAERSLDPSEEVRLKVVSVAAVVATASPAGLSLLGPSLPEVFGRILDKRPAVREACAEQAAKLYAAHALPEVSAGRLVGRAEELCWVPQLLCEAFHVFSQGRHGHGARLEELLEQHVLGCGAKDFGAPERARCLVALCGAAFAEEASSRGLALLLSRKRDAHAALRRYVQLRAARGAPLLEPQRARDSAQSALEAVVQHGLADGGAGAVSDEAEAMAVARELARASPASEDRAARPEVILLQMRLLDAVRDRALWAQLELVTRPTPEETTEDLGPQIAELDRLLRAHRLTDLGPTLRRALLATWLLPEQVPCILERWSGEDRPLVAIGASPLRGGRGRRRSGGARSAGAAGQATPAHAHLAVAHLPKYMPGPFSVHAAALARRLDDDTLPAEDGRLALRALAAVGKRAALLPSPSSFGLEGGALADGLIEVLRGVSAEAPVALSGLARRAARCLELLPAASGARAAAEERLAAWIRDRCLQGAAGSPLMALHLAAAFAERELARGTAWAAEKGAGGGDGGSPWSDLGREVLGRYDVAAGDVDALCAAADVCLMVGDADDVTGCLQRAKACSVDADIQVLALTLRPLRRGVLPLTVDLLATLASHILGVVGVRGGVAGDCEVLLDSLQRLQKPTGVQARLFDRLRLSITLPALFALSPLKKHREAAQRVVHTALARAARQQQQQQQEPFLDIATACFVHFLSRLDPFTREASATASAYPESSKISEVFCEALLRCEPSRKPTELGVVALRVCDRVRYFEDRGRPGSNAVHKAASVLRHVVEKHCPDLGKRVAGLLLQGGPRGSMPAELFAIRQDLAGSAAAGAIRGAEAEASGALPAPAPVPLPSPLPPAASGGGAAADGSPERGASSVAVAEVALVAHGGSPGGTSPGTGDAPAVAGVARPMASTSRLFGGFGGSAVKRPHSLGGGAAALSADKRTRHSYP